MSNALIVVVPLRPDGARLRENDITYKFQIVDII